MTPTGLDFLDLQLWIRLLWNSKWLISLFALCSAIVFFSLTFLTIPTYRVTAILADSTDQTSNQALLSGQLGSLASLTGIQITNEVRPSDEALAVLSSDEFLRDFILMHDILPVLFAGQWNVESKAWSGKAEDRPTIGQAIRDFRSRVVADRDRRTGLVTLSVEWNDASIAASWCDLLVGELNSEMQRRALVQARTHIEYLRKQLNLDANIEVREAIVRLLEMQLKQEMLASVPTDYAFRVVSRGLEPEADEYVSPRRGLVGALGLMFGFAAGVILAFFRFERRNAAARNAN
jgi:uncharacterized protein involved in exopolysaccharide biosynthesis